MRKKNIDLPLHLDPGDRFVPWVVGLMVYLAVLCLVMAVVVSQGINKWDDSFLPRLTLEVPSTSESFNSLGASIQEGGLPQNLKELLLRTPGVKKFKPIEVSVLKNTLEPWLGKSDLLGHIPLPILIDVELHEENTLNVGALTERLVEIIPGAVIEDHRLWQGNFLKLIRSIEMIAFLVVGLICVATISTVAFTTQTGLIIHRDIVEILHLIGAYNGYIAKQFQGYIMRIGIKGGVIGFVLSTITFFGFDLLMKSVGLYFFPHLSFSFWVWSITLLIPLVVILFMVLSARLTVLWALERMT